ncbi:MAG: phytanoyl-CoA dioxygenase family protein [Sulfurimonas sp.]|nr:MAG: phytanoyl-CoA dioxygenase family protein [Sulfurimonas sp.]
MYLTQEQVTQFFRDGYIILRKVLSSEETEALRHAALRHVTAAEAPVETEEEYHNLHGDTSTLRRLRQVYHRDPLFARWMTRHSMRPILKQLLNDTPVLTLAHHNSIMTKFPSTISSTCWHQDRRYWHFKNDNLLSVWLSLGEEYLDNGLLEFIPGSHKMQFSAEQFTPNQCFRTDLQCNQEVLARRVHSNLHAGDIVLFHCQTLHSAHANATQETKISFVYTVRGQKNVPVEGTRSASKEIILDDVEA